ncbi:hypothetical protein C8Q73DRAFT_534057 [Cubamyces lactineus]|nr:hypothetical protein C8Q73DRAFT_534057 [Cubamyces lactineus]
MSAPDSVDYTRSAIARSTRHHSHHALPPALVFAILATLVSPFLPPQGVIRGAAPLRIPAFAHLGSSRKPSWAVCMNAGQRHDILIISTAYRRGIRQSPVSYSHARHPALLRRPSLDLARCASTHRPQRVHCPPSPARPPKLEGPVALALLPFPCSVPSYAHRSPRLRLPIWGASPSLVTLLSVCPLCSREHAGLVAHSNAKPRAHLQRSRRNRESIPPRQERAAAALA